MKRTTAKAVAPAKKSATEEFKPTKLRIVKARRDEDGKYVDNECIGHHWLSRSGNCSQIINPRALGALLLTLAPDEVVTIFHTAYSEKE